MDISVTLPFDHPDDGVFCRPEVLTEVCARLERAGFAGACVTDHPVPTGRWLDGGGHQAQDPFVMLALVGAASRTLRLETGILVLPYRNPFLTARAVATLDVFSSGRVSLGVGAGYLNGEFRALGADFARRGEITDEYLRALKAAWSGEEFSFSGSGYEARGNRILPAPVQQPHPPLLIGGNTPRAIRRAVELGDAWNPFFTSAGVSTTARTAEMSAECDLAEGMTQLRRRSERAGRERPPATVVTGLTALDEGIWNPGVVIDRIGRLTELGVSGASIQLGGATPTEWCENAERFGAEVISALD